MRRIVTSLVSLAAAGVLLALARPQPEPETTSGQDGRLAGPVGSFGENPAWDDGKAELSRYAAEELVEGEKRSFEAWSIVVAEHFDPKQMVKKDGFDLAFVPVLKCNWFLRIPTGVYAYQQMASLFLRRSDLLVQKAAFSSQEWCGQTFAEWRRDQPGFITRSYWDGEADATHELPDLAPDTLFYEQVPLWVRGRRPERVRSEPIVLIAKRLGTSHCPPPKLVPATLNFDGVKGDGAEKRIEARLAFDGKEELFVLAPEFPFTLREWLRADGTLWKLLSSERLDYWKFSKNEFAGKLEPKPDAKK